MIIDIYLNDKFYKRKDLGTRVHDFKLSEVVSEIHQDYDGGLISKDITDHRHYSLQVRVVEH